MEQRFGPYQVGETIGRGTFAKVKLAVHEATKTKVALKVIPRRVMEEDPKSEIKIKREIKILQVLRHPHVMRQYDVVQTKHDIILVLEYVSGGELFDYISRRGRLHESLARLFFQQLIAAVGYCHLYNVAHRDLKPENILLEQNLKSIKIGDFGLSSIMRDGRLFETSCGTPNYAAPEVVSGKLYSGREADVWSCGVVLFTMLAGGLPFDDPYVNLLFKKIQNANYQIPSFVPKGAQDIISRMLVPDPLERATIEQIVQHPWVREQFPAYLVTVHTEALYQAARFARDAKMYIADQLDTEVVAYVAARFRLQPQQVVAIIEAAEREGSSAKGRHVRITDAYMSVADDKVKPEPLVIPLAEEKLRNEEHDVLISYNILLDRKLMRKSMVDGTPPSGNSTGSGANASKHVDPNGGGSAGDGTGRTSKGSHEGAQASSFIAMKYGASGAAGPMSAIPAPVSAVEYGSLRGVSYGPHSHKPMQRAGGQPTGQLQRAPDGTMHFSPLYAATHTAAAPQAPFVDVYIAGYNQLAKPRLEARTAGHQTLIGAFFGLTGSASSDSKVMMPSAEPARVSSGLHKSGSLPGKREALLKPLLSPVEQEDVVAAAAPQDDVRPNLPSTAVGSSGVLVACAEESTSGRFGAEFMRNGVLFRRTDAQGVFHWVCVALRSCGFLWKAMYPFMVVAVRHPSDKIICRIYKVESEVYLVDVRLACTSGMSGLDAATEVLMTLLSMVPSSS